MFEAIKYKLFNFFRVRDTKFINPQQAAMAEIQRALNEEKLKIELEERHDRWEKDVMRLKRERIERLVDSASEGVKILPPRPIYINCAGSILET